MKRLGILLSISILLTNCSFLADTAVTDFHQCVEAGNPIMESYPRQCSHKGTTFTEELPPETPDHEIACTLDAKLCPDGTAVGRVGPNCEFAPCPDETNNSTSIQVNSPLPNQTISSPVTITGIASGDWFFEGQFSITIYNASGEILGNGTAFAQSEWTVSDPINFSATVEFTPRNAINGTILLTKANPSGLAENADSIVIPVNYK